MTTPTCLHLLAYFFGSIGILLEWRAYSLNSGQAFRRWSALGALFWAAQYVLLNAWTAGLTMASTALRTRLSGKIENSRHRHGIAVGFIALFAGLTAMSWQGGISLLPAVAVVNTTLALFYLGNRGMRIALLASSAAWVANDFYWQAWPSLLAESVAILINLRTLKQLNHHEHEISAKTAKNHRRH